MASNPSVHAGLQRALRAANDHALQHRHEYVTLEHLLLSLLQEPHVATVVQQCEGHVGDMCQRLDQFLQRRIPSLAEDAAVGSPQQTVDLERVLNNTAIHAISSEMSELDGRHVLVQILEEPDSFASYVMRLEGLSPLVLKQVLSGMHGEPFHGDPMESEPPEDLGGDSMAPEMGDSEAPSPRGHPLTAYTTDLVAQAREGFIDPLVGREREVARVIQILGRRRKCNPLLVGEPGVGKTAIAEGLALHIAEDRVPGFLADTPVYALDLGGILAGTKYRGQFEQRLKGVLKSLPDGAILFVDEIHTLVGAGSTQGGSLDASNLLKPLLANGRLRCMGATTYQEYKGGLEREPAFARRFQTVDIEPPSEEQAVEILRGLQERYEQHHRVTYTPESIEAAVALAHKHLTDRFLPDTAIDLIDEAGSAKRAHTPAAPEAAPEDGTEGDSPTGTIDVVDIETTVSRMAKIPPASVSSDDRQALRSLESDLRQVIFGQDEAVERLASAVQLARAGLRADSKPVGSFLFCGPTGVGKTELARQLATHLGVPCERFDMSEYGEAHSLSRLIGSPPGYVGYDRGGLLTDAIRQHPHCVLLLDEIEKAHPDLFHLLLQVMDHAQLTDNSGKRADFRHVTLIMTSNLGVRDAARSTVGFGDHSGDMASATKAAVERAFSPEFRNRLDATIQFGPLSKGTMERIVKKSLNELQALATTKSVNLQFDDSVVSYLTDKGFEPTMGARPLARLIEQQIKLPLAKLMLFEHSSGKADSLTVRVQEEGNTLTLASA